MAMQTLSRWANTHLWQARILIVGIHVLITILAIRLGLRLFLNDFHFSALARFFFIGIFLTAWIAYPLYQQRSNYARQKCTDFLLALGTFLMLTYVGNQLPYTLSLATSPTEAHATFSALKEKQEAKTALSFKNVRKSIKSYFKNRIASLQKERAEGNETLRITLIILGALGLLVLLAGLACSISCNGAEGVAIATFIVGLAGVVWLTIFLIRRISSKRRQNATG